MCKYIKVVLALRLIFVSAFIIVPVVASRPMQLVFSINDQQGPIYLEELFRDSPAPEKITLQFYETLDKLNVPSLHNENRLKRLYVDILDIASAEELAKWRRLKTSEEKIAFLKRFWLERDPTPATAVNERLIEHYKRILHARARYSAFDIRRYDDRGMIYVKYGEPDDKVEDVINSRTAPVSSWVYNRFGRPIHFDFIDKGSGYYQLNSRLTDAIVVFSPVSYLEAIEELVGRRLILHSDYTKLFWDIQEARGRRGPRPPRDPVIGFNDIRTRLDLAFNQFVMDTRKHHALSPTVVTSVLEDFKNLPCCVTIAQFQSNDQGANIIAIYGFKKTDLQGVADTLRLQAISVIRDTALVMQQRRSLQLNIMQKDSANTTEIVAANTYALASGKYYFLLDIENRIGHQRGLRDFSFILGQYPKGTLHLSNVLFAKDVVSAQDSLQDHRAFQRHHLAIFPYPFTSFKRNARLFVYFEIYDLQRDLASGETSYDIQYEIKAPEKNGLLASLNPFGKSGGSISVSETRRGKAATEPTYLQLDFSQLRNGKYDLIVRVTDLLAKVTKESKLAFELE